MRCAAQQIRQTTPRGVGHNSTSSKRIERYLENMADDDKKKEQQKKSQAKANQSNEVLYNVQQLATLVNSGVSAMAW